MDWLFPDHRCWARPSILRLSTLSLTIDLTLLVEEPINNEAYQKILRQTCRKRPDYSETEILGKKKYGGNSRTVQILTSRPVANLPDTASRKIRCDY